MFDEADPNDFVEGSVSVTLLSLIILYYYNMVASIMIVQYDVSIS